MNQDKKTLAIELFKIYQKHEKLEDNIDTSDSSVCYVLELLTKDYKIKTLKMFFDIELDWFQMSNNWYKIEEINSRVSALARHDQNVISYKYTVYKLNNGRMIKKIFEIIPDLIKGR
jgi:hypothetical protein